MDTNKAKDGADTTAINRQLEHQVAKLKVDVARLHKSFNALEGAVLGLMMDSGLPIHFTELLMDSRNVLTKTELDPVEVIVVNHGAQFGHSDWYTFYCGICGASAERKQHGSDTQRCSRCDSNNIWPKRTQL